MTKELTVKEIMEESYSCALDKGWWDQEMEISDELQHFVIAAKLLLFDSETAEATEVLRKVGADGLKEVWYREEDGKPEGFTVELADIIIRIVDLCAHYELDIVGALKEKMVFNRTRPFRHGGKCL